MLDEQGRRAAFAAFVARLPVAMEADLMSGDNISTSFLAALQAGWPIDQLADDALAAWNRSSGAMGVVVARFRAFAENPPADPEDRRKATAARAKPLPKWKAEPPRKLSPEEIAQRRDVLRRAQAGLLTPDEAEAEMRKVTGWYGAFTDRG